MRIIAIFLCAVALSSSSVYGETFYIEASRKAIVRDQPNKDAKQLLKLDKGEQLDTVTDQQTEGFYNVFLPNGTTGWISRYVVRLHEGQTPDAPPVAVMPDVGGGLTTSERESAAFHLLIGKPKAYKEIIRKGYIVGYDPKLKIPAWVQYRLTREHSDNNSFPRSDDFREDASVPPQARAILSDYAEVTDSYVRGHMAPAEDMRWSESAEEESNLLTNIAPQIGSTFNGSIWKTIENRVRGWVIDRQDLTIICGPVFETRQSVYPIDRQPATERQMVYNVVGDNDVAVPTAFFKIIVDMRNQANPNVLAFLIPHIETVKGPERKIETYLKSVDHIEELTGLDFLTNLPDTVQEEIESVTPTKAW